MNRPYETQLALDKAQDCLADSDFNLSGGRTIATVNRAYYGMYYCLCALLFTENIVPKTHKGSQQKFSELFVKTNRFPIETAKWVSDAFNLRQFGDYDLEATISDEEAQQLVQQAHQFYDLTQAYVVELIRTSS